MISTNENIINIIQNGDNALKLKWLNRLDMRQKTLTKNINELNNELKEVTELINEINNLPIKSNLIQLNSKIKS